jgi:hypothetical protein
MRYTYIYDNFLYEKLYYLASHTSIARNRAGRREEGLMARQRIFSLPCRRAAGICGNALLDPF